MKKFEWIQRYLLIIRIVRNREGITFKELHEAVRDELRKRGYERWDVSDSTLKRDLRVVHDELKVPIEHEPGVRGYWMLKSREGVSDSIEYLLEPFDILNALSGNSDLQRIVLTDRRMANGAEQLPLLLQAIEAQRFVRFRYQKFDDKPPVYLNVAPYAVKNWRNRWYVLGFKDGEDILKTFGLDRLSELELARMAFERREDVDPRAKFKDCFGIVNFEDKPVEEVRLAFNYRDGQYVSSLPLHASQVVEEHDKEKDRCVISLRVKITPDFVMELLSRVSSMEVLAPVSLRKEIADCCAKAALRNKVEDGD